MKKSNNYDVDIIMGIYNCEEYLAKSIESVLSQTYKNWRLIMCDDGSTDNTLSIANGYKVKYPEKIVVLKNEKNMGLNYTLNKCLDFSDAEYIARQDGDDLSVNTRLEKEVEFLKNNKDYSFVSCNASLFDESRTWGRLLYKERPNKYDFLKISPFCHAAALIRKNDFIIVGGYSVDDKLLRVEDYHLWFKLYSKGFKGYNIQEELYCIRDDENAARRRTWKNRLNEYYVRKVGYKMLNIEWYKRISIFRPIILGLIPNNLYLFLHRSKMKPITSKKEN